MEQNQWSGMSPVEQAEYLKKHEIKMKVQTFADGNSPVGKVKVTTARAAICGGVNLTGWRTDDAKTVMAAAKERIDCLGKGD